MFQYPCDHSYCVSPGSRCRWLPGIRNGVVTRKESNGDVLQMYFTCNKGYTLNGHDTLTCGGNAEWDHPVPNCRYSKTQHEYQHP